MFKSSFFNIVKEKITVYEDKLHYQNVNSYPYPEFELKNPPSKLKLPYISPFMHDTQKMLFERYLKLNKPDRKEQRN